MSNAELDTTKVLSATADAINQLTDLMSSVDNEKVNDIPYEGSWIAPQLLRHVTKSIDAMTKSMHIKAEPAERNPEERVEQLKGIFLDYSKKFTQPDFLIPEEQVYDKQASIDELNNSFKKFEESTRSANLTDLVDGLPFGPTTKFEIIHFVLYHTQRHLNQMKRICEALNNR